MAFLGDYHTHTIFSHGKGSVEDNVVKAIERGLKQVAITDHGFKHLTYNVRRLDWPFMEKEVKKMRLKYPEIEILLGLETNFSSPDGNIDVLLSEIEAMDIVVCGYHNMVKPERIRHVFSFWTPNLIIGSIFKKTTKKMFIRNTDAYLKAIEKYPIDIVSHPNYTVQVDVVEIAKACKRLGSYFELNGKRISITDKQLEEVANTGVEFICNSDAHHHDKVGNFDYCLQAVNRVGVPYSQIANWDRLPQLRSQIFKQKLKGVTADELL